MKTGRLRRLLCLALVLSVGAAAGAPGAAGAGGQVRTVRLGDTLQTKQWPGGSCPGVTTLAVRGSGEAPQGGVGLSAYNTSSGWGMGKPGGVTARRLRTIASHRGATSGMEGALYAAEPVGTILRNADRYVNSIVSGADAVIRQVRVRANADCARRPVINLVGYSQGAWSIRVAVLRMRDKNPELLRAIGGIVLYGDPAYRSTEPIVRWNVPRSERVGIAHARALRGAPDWWLNPFPKAVATRTSSYCLSDDVVCRPNYGVLLAGWTGFATAVVNGYLAHTTYPEHGLTDRGENWLARLIPVISTPATLPAATVGQRYTLRLRTADDRAGEWSLTAGSLPAGLSLHAGTGTISGTPGGAATASTFEASFRGSSQISVTRRFSLVVNGTRPITDPGSYTLVSDYANGSGTKESSWQAMSGDGQQVLFSTSPDNSVVMWSRSTGGYEKLAGDGTYLALSADASTAAWLVHDPDGGVFGRGYLVVFDTVTRQETQVTTQNTVAYGASVSSSGTWVAFDCIDIDARQSNLCLWNTRTGTLTRRTDISDVSGRPVMSGDGSTVIFEQWRKNPATGERQSLLTLWDRSAETFTRLSDNGWEPSISRNGTWIAYTTTGDGGPTTTDVVVLNRDSGSTTNVSAALGYEAFESDISADGSRIVFHSYSNAVASEHIWVWDRATATFTRVTPPADGQYAWAPQISADGHTVTFQSMSQLSAADDDTSGTDTYLWVAPD